MPIRCLRPRAGDEVDFDITNPPLEPVTPPGKVFLGLIDTNLTANDVVLGRGQNTSCRAGNRLFRSLVADFQPLYLTLRRRDKPKIIRTIVLIVRHRGGRFLRRVGEEGNDNARGKFLYEAGDERAEKKTVQALRDGLAIRAKMIALKGRVGFQEKVNGGDRMVAEHQEHPDEEGLIAWGEEEEMMTMSKSTIHQNMLALREGWDLNCKEYYKSEGLCNGCPSSLTERKEGAPLVTLPSGFESALLQRSCNNTVSPKVNHPPLPANNSPCLNAVPPHPFVFGQRPLFSICRPNVLSYIGLMQWYHHSNADCYRPMHCNSNLPPNHCHGIKLLQAHPQSPPTIINDTLLSSSVAGQSCLVPSGSLEDTLV